MTKPCWKRLSSGKYIDLANFTPECVELSDISTSLNGIERFTGHWKDTPPLNVAQHSYMCLLLAQIMEPDEKELHQWVFSHDFAEAYIGDVATPVKKAMGKFWYDFAGPIEASVELAVMGCEMPPEMADRVKVYDLCALDIERRVMWSSQYGKDKWPMAPLNFGTLEDKQNIFDNARIHVDIEAVWEKLK